MYILLNAGDKLIFLLTFDVCMYGFYYIFMDSLKF